MTRKIIFILVLACIGLGLPSYVGAQEGTSLRDRLNRKQQQSAEWEDKQKNIPQLSVRAQMKNNSNTQDLTKATWIREVYRLLDLTKGTNAALFYPVTPIEDRMNLYTLIFKLMANGELEAYAFNDSQPVFSERYKVKPEDMFERLEIGYSSENGSLVYDEFSIPSNEVLGYYIKEAWYFDQSNSVLDVKIVAICPVLYRNVLDGFDISISSESSTREPQFWIPYENIRPYVARMPIMTSDVNNALTQTVDDYFRLRLYEGEIYKTTNMENKLLVEKYGTPEEVEQAREEIEQQLQEFEKGLWVIDDSLKVSDGVPKKRDNKKEIDRPKLSSKSGSSNATHSARERRKKF